MRVAPYYQRAMPSHQYRIPRSARWAIRASRPAGNGVASRGFTDPLARGLSIYCRRARDRGGPGPPASCTHGSIDSAIPIYHGPICGKVNESKPAGSESLGPASNMAPHGWPHSRPAQAWGPCRGHRVAGNRREGVRLMRRMILAWSFLLPLAAPSVFGQNLDWVATVLP